MLVTLYTFANRIGTDSERPSDSRFAAWFHHCFGTHYMRASKMRLASAHLSKRDQMRIRHYRLTAGVPEESSIDA